MAVTTLFAFIIMKEDYFVRGVFSWKRGLTSMRDIALSSVRYGTQHKAVRFILIITGIQIFAVQALNMYWQPFFRNHKVSEQHLGFLYTAMMTALAAGAFIVSRLDCKGKEKKMIIRSQICTGVLVIAAVLVPGLPFIVILFIVHEMPRGCLTPLVDSYLQKRIPSAERATIASFCAIAPHIGGAIGLVVSGLIAQFCGISVAWIVAGGWKETAIVIS
jgi:sugar phosphate permease